MSRVQRPIISIKNIPKFFLLVLTALSSIKMTFSKIPTDANSSFSAVFHENDFLPLSELSLEKLLKIKKSLNDLKFPKFDRFNEMETVLESRMNDDRISVHEQLENSPLTSFKNEIKINR